MGLLTAHRPFASSKFTSSPCCPLCFATPTNPFSLTMTPASSFCSSGDGAIALLTEKTHESTWCVLRVSAENRKLLSGPGDYAHRPIQARLRPVSTDSSSGREQGRERDEGKPSARVQPQKLPRQLSVSEGGRPWALAHAPPRRSRSRYVRRPPRFTPLKELCLPRPAQKCSCLPSLSRFCECETASGACTVFTQAAFPAPA